MRFILKIVTVLVIAILIISGGFYFFFNRDNSNDTEEPIIESITGNIFTEQGDQIVITVSFSDNDEVTSAIIYYKMQDADIWSDSSILSGIYTFHIPENSPKDWYYYIVIDDKAGNGPIGDPSTDGSTYYTIEVADQVNNGDDEEIVHTVFVEESTATDCQYCPYAAEKLHELYVSGDYRFYYVSMVEDVNDKASERLNDEYNLQGNPTVFIDGGYRVIIGGLNPLSDYITAIRSAESRSVPKIKINISSQYDNTSETISAEVTIVNYENDSYTGNLRVYLTENISRWNDYNGSKYRFSFYDYIIQEDITIIGNNQEVVSASYGVTDLDPENLVIIAVIFSSESQTAYADPENNENPFDAYYADACDATEVIEGGNLPPEVGITFPQQGQIYFRGRHTLKFPVRLFNLVRQTTTLTNTYLLGVSTITAYAEDESAIDRVEFYINGDLVFNDTEEPYEFGKQSLFFKKPLVLPRKTEIMVRAYDDQGKSSSATIKVIAWRAFVY